MITFEKASTVASRDGSQSIAAGRGTVETMNNPLSASRHALPTVATLVLTVTLGAGSAVACACCAEPGHRSERTEPISPDVRNELAAIRLAPVASLYNGARGAEGVKGVRGASDNPYKITLARADGKFVFDLVDANGQSGRVTLAFPRQMSQFDVDRRNEKSSTSFGPTLYKEWRLEGPATLGGIFSGATGPITARLVLQGEGNLCAAAPNFTHWNLTVTGAGRMFSFFGDTKL